MKLYFRYFLILVRSQMQYKTSFFLLLTGQFLGAFGSLLAVWFLMARFRQVDGFTGDEVLLCFAVVTMAFSLAECFGRGFDRFPHILGNGEFDRVLLRPRSAMFQVLTSQLDLSRLGKLVQAVVVLLWVLPRCGVEWDAPRVLTLVLMIVCGAIVFCGLFILYASFCFVTLEGLEFFNVLTNGGMEFGRYPFSIYGSGVLRFFTFVVPLACFQYYPLLYLTGRSCSPLCRWLPLAALPFLVPCCLAWRQGVRHFRSTGS